jgi:DNA-binding transcriptional MerR regulator
MKTAIELALEAGFQLADQRLYVDDRDGVCQEEVERLVALARADEREAHAELVETMGMQGYGTLAIAAAIRARGNA